MTYEASVSPEVRLLCWIAENPAKAVDIGVKLVALGLVVAFIGALFSK